MAKNSQPIGCVKAATDIIGDKWTPLLIRFIANCNQARFCQLQDNVGGINPRTLSARLAKLEDSKIIEKSSDVNSSRSQYCLTQKGQDLVPILRDMEAWGLRYYENKE